jgi:hypothetical protein
VYKTFVGKSKGKRPLGRRRRRWKDGLKMDLGEIDWDAECTQMTQDGDRWRAVVNAVMNLQVLSLRT